MIDFYCAHCKGRFVGEGEGVGRVRLQCRECGRWQWVRLAGTDDSPRPLAKQVATA